MIAKALFDDHTFPTGPCGPIHQTDSRAPKTKPSFTGKPRDQIEGLSKGYPQQVDGYGLKPYAFPTGPCGPINQTESRAPKTKPSFTGKPPELDRGAVKGLSLTGGRLRAEALRLFVRAFGQ